MPTGSTITAAAAASLILAGLALLFWTVLAAIVATCIAARSNQAISRGRRIAAIVSERGMFSRRPVRAMGPAE